MGLIFDSHTGMIYDKWYHSPEGRAIEKGIENIFRDLVNRNAREKLLDIGCGSGNHLLMFSRMGLNVSGIDASEDMVRYATKRIGNCYTVKKAYAEDIPFDDNEFDIVVLINTLEFLDNPVQVLREAGRVARRFVFIGVTNGLSFNGLLGIMSFFSRDPILSHLRYYNRWRLKKIITRVYPGFPVSWFHAKASSTEDNDRAYDRDLYTDIFDNPFSGHDVGWNFCREKTGRRYRFDPLLCAAVTMKYTVQTDNLALKLGLGKVSSPVEVTTTVYTEGVEKKEP